MRRSRGNGVHALDLWSLKGSDNLAWCEAPGDRAQGAREPCRGDIDLEELLQCINAMPGDQSQWSHHRLSSISRPFGALMSCTDADPGLRCAAPWAKLSEPLRAPERARAHATPATFNACTRIALILRARERM